MILSDLDSGGWMLWYILYLSINDMPLPLKQSPCTKHSHTHTLYTHVAVIVKNNASVRTIVNNRRQMAPGLSDVVQK